MDVSDAGQKLREFTTPPESPNTEAILKYLNINMMFQVTFSFVFFYPFFFCCSVVVVV